jgi:hypothetical protein
MRHLALYTWVAAFAVMATDFATVAAPEARVSTIALADFSSVDSDLAVVPGSGGVAARVPSPTAAEEGKKKRPKILGIRTIKNKKR